MWPEEIDKVFVLIHERKEKERYARLAPHLLSRGIPADRIYFCAPTWGSELSNETIFNCYDPFCRPGVPVFTFKARSLSKGEISLVLNFYAAAQAAVQNSMKKIIILESDVGLRKSGRGCENTAQWMRVKYVWKNKDLSAEPPFRLSVHGLHVVSSALFEEDTSHSSAIQRMFGLGIKYTGTCSSK